MASTVQVPGAEHNEVLQIVKEYLSGLVESGPIRETFLAWARHLPDGSRPATDEVVVPDPVRLEMAATAAMLKTLSTYPITDLWASKLNESPVDTAVDLANRTRYADEGTGPCAGCPRPVRPGEEPYGGPGERPVEPPHFVR